MGFADPTDFQIAATNLTAIKARLLLMACHHVVKQFA
jgi:L-asparaginase